MRDLRVNKRDLEVIKLQIVMQTIRVNTFIYGEIHKVKNLGKVSNINVNFNIGVRY